MSRYSSPPLPSPLGWDGNGQGSERTGYLIIGFPVVPAPPKGGGRQELEGNLTGWPHLRTRIYGTELPVYGYARRAVQGRGWLTQRFENAQQNGWEILDYQSLLDKIEPHLDCKAICPAADNIFKAFELLRPEDVEYVILGQDPYWQISGDDAQPIATGLAFGVRQKERPHPATAIHKILRQIYQYGPRHEWDWTLESWAKNYKILLLNTALTVPMPKQGENGREKSANRHLPHWKEFTKVTLSFLRDNQRQFSTNHRFKCIAWGKKAKTAFEEVGLTPIFAYHPCASVVGPMSFNEFWEKDGQCLIWPAS